MKNLKKFLLSFVLVLFVCAPTFAFAACKNDNNTPAEKAPYTREQASALVNTIYNGVTGDADKTGVTAEAVVFTENDVENIQSPLTTIKALLSDETSADKYYTSTAQLNENNLTAKAKYELLQNKINVFLAITEDETIFQYHSITITQNKENDWHITIINWVEGEVAQKYVTLTELNSTNGKIYYYRNMRLITNKELTKDSIIEEDLTKADLTYFYYVYADARNQSTNTKTLENVSESMFTKIHSIMKTKI